MASQFAMRIIYVPTGEYVDWAPGSPIESLVIDAALHRVRAKGVGVMRTEAHVLADVEQALTETLFDLKKQVK
jgi:hypothetical protein